MRKAVEAVNGELFDALSGMEAEQQAEIDETMTELDGTANKARLGANAILGVSLAVARAAAGAAEVPLFRYVGGVAARDVPVPMMNVINGGAHADNAIDFQEFMIVPVSAPTFAEALRMGAEIFHVLRARLGRDGHNTNVGDEGGFAPALASAAEALGAITAAIEEAGYRPGEDVLLALDAASTELFDGNRYRLAGEDRELDADAMVACCDELASRFPIVSIEDAMAEDDWDGWAALTSALGAKIQLVGDDVFVTNPARLADGFARNVANAVLIKPNQIGTLTETLRAIEMAKKAGYGVIVSHRSGETEDTFIADLAVATNCGQIKTGSLARTDRLAKYNQLLRIEEELGSTARYPGSAAFDHIGRHNS